MPDASDPRTRAEGEPAPADLTSTDQHAHRLAKIEAMRAAGVDPYPVRFERTTTAGALHAAHDAIAPGTETDETVKVAGRVMLLRRQGKLTFATMHDRDDEIQLVVDSADLGDAVHHDFDQLDRGDWVGVEGTVMTTRRGELSIRVHTFQLLAKAIRPLPDKWHGLTDTDTRYRQRYVDLVVNEEARRIALVRIQTISRIRHYLESQGFLEVEGPVLQNIQGGATARPFITHHNALDVDLYLRIALELHLKRLIVGGLDRVFEFGRVFRNEGMDTAHNPEFTMLEAYQAFADYHDMMDLTEAIVLESARGVLDSELTVTYDGHELDFTPPFRRVTMVELIKEQLGVDLTPATPVEEARKVLDGLEVDYETSWGSGRLVNAVYERIVQHRVIAPTFVLDHPREVSPLARRHRDDAELTERFELVVAGHELANAFSELNDPIDQLRRFEDEARAKACGDLEAGDVDLDYVRALEYGLPPTGGLGIGIDRLVMYLTGTSSIREVILFPTLRSEAGMGGLGATTREVDAGSEAPEREAIAGSVEAPPPAPPRASRRAVLLISWLVALGGLLWIATLVPWFHDHLEPVRDDTILPFELRVGGRVAAVIFGMFMLVLADQLAKGKRRAWQLATGVSALAVLLHILKGPHFTAAGVALLILVLLLVYRDRFRAPSDPPSALRLLRVGLLFLGVVYGVGCIALLTERSRITPSVTFAGMLETISLGLFSVSGPYTYDDRLFADVFPAVLLALGVVGLIGLIVLLFRPLIARASDRDADLEHAERLVKSYGWDTLAYFSLREDKSFFFSSDAEAMIAYAYMGGYGMCSGDPIGRPESISLVVDEFLAFCHERAWKAAFLAVRESDLELYTSRGLRHMYLGDEAVIHCDSFDLDRPGMRGVRQAVHRVGREYTSRLLQEAAASPELVAELNAMSGRWRGKQPELGFTMALSQDVEGENPEFLLFVAFDAGGKAGGFLRFVPAYGSDFGYTLDLMRHDPGAPNGMTEFLISNAALALKERNIVRLSMNFAPWGRLLDPAVQHTPLQRVAAWWVRRFPAQTDSLRDFNEKFAPEWLPRVIAFPAPLDLPRVGLLYAGAEGFLTVPLLGQLLVPPRHARVHARVAAAPS